MSEGCGNGELKVSHEKTLSEAPLTAYAERPSTSANHDDGEGGGAGEGGEGGGEPQQPTDQHKPHAPETAAMGIADRTVVEEISEELQQHWRQSNVDDTIVKIQSQVIWCLYCGRRCCFAVACWLVGTFPSLFSIDKQRCNFRLAAGETTPSASSRRAAEA